MEPDVTTDEHGLLQLPQKKPQINTDDGKDLFTAEDAEDRNKG